MDLSQMFDATEDGLAVVDADGRVLYRNRAAAEYLGDATHGGFFRPGGDADAVHTQAIRGVAAPRTDVAAGDRIAEVTAALLPGGATVVLVWRDVTEARRHTAVLSRFAAVLAHDLRNPLSVVESWSALLADTLAELPAGPERQEAELATGRIGRAAARMRTLISDLLTDLTADRLPARAPVVLGDLVAEVAAARLDLAAGSGGPVPRFTIGELPVVPGDAALLRQLLENLIGNAVKYTAPGVVPHVAIHASGPAAIHIDDNGIGVPAPERASIFDDHYRASFGVPGFGLGLGICRRIVERHGGTIEVGDNPAGGGSRFTVRLPGPAPAELPKSALTLFNGWERSHRRSPC